MATIEIERRSSLDHRTLLANAAAIAEKIAAEYGIQWRWDAMSTAACVIVFDTPSGLAKGTKGSLSVCSDGLVRIRIELPMMLWGAKSKIEKTVAEYMDGLVA